MKTILQALGAEVDDAESIVDWSLRWQTEAWVTSVAIGFVVVALLACWFYARSPQEVKSGRRWLLTLTRLAFLALLLALVLRPVLLLTSERKVPTTLPILVDRSNSMSLRDGAEPRLERVKAVLAGSPLALGEVEQPTMSFAAAQVVSMEDLSALEVSGNRTELGGALLNVVERFRGAPLAGVLAFTDGGQNEGVALAEVGQQLKEAGIPLFLVGVGDAATRDVSIGELDLSEVLLADDPASVSVRLGGQGMKGASGRVIFSLGGVEVASEAVTFGEEASVTVETLIVPKRAGEYVLEARFEGDDGNDALAQNNQTQSALRVVDRRLRVLLLDQAPRWEYKYLEAMLHRERRVQLSCFLVEGDPENARVPGSPYLGEFPTQAEDLYSFDLVILGDIAPEFLSLERQRLLAGYVSEAGGALVVLAGKRFVPEQFRDSELARLLPVELAGTSINAENRVSSQPVRLELTDSGRRSVMLQLSDNDTANTARWSRLPPIYWSASVAQAKPAAEVLLTRPDPSGEYESIPVLAMHRYGAGEVLFLGTDNLWRWRRNVGSRDHTTIWGQIIQRMAGARLLTEEPRLTLQSDRKSYREGDRVQVFARIFERDWNPREDETVMGVLVNSENPEDRREVHLRLVPGQLGRYRGEFSAGESGQYCLALGGEDVATLDFSVREDDREFSRAGLNERLLQDLAKETGGAYVSLERLQDLPEAITRRTAQLRSVKEVDLWSSPLIFAILILLLTAEWILRKFSELK